MAFEASERRHELCIGHPLPFSLLTLCESGWLPAGSLPQFSMALGTLVALGLLAFFRIGQFAVHTPFVFRLH